MLVWSGWVRKWGKRKTRWACKPRSAPAAGKCVFLAFSRNTPCCCARCQALQAQRTNTHAHTHIRLPPTQNESVVVVDVDVASAPDWQSFLCTCVVVQQALQKPSLSMPSSSSSSRRPTQRQSSLSGALSARAHALTLSAAGWRRRKGCTRTHNDVRLQGTPTKYYIAPEHADLLQRQQHRQLGEKGVGGRFVKLHFRVFNAMVERGVGVRETMLTGVSA